MKQEFTITIYTENQVGLLTRIAIMFSRRKINVESMNTSPSEVEGIHRFTIVVNPNVAPVDKYIDIGILLNPVIEDIKLLLELLFT